MHDVETPRQVICLALFWEILFDIAATMGMISWTGRDSQVKLQHSRRTKR
jgi:hypothetical protein